MISTLFYDWLPGILEGLKVKLKTIRAEEKERKTKAKV
jgi:hypothetical protein